jgi:hypothetical protein
MTILILSVFYNKFTTGIPCNKMFFEMTMTIFFSQIYKNCKFTKTKNQVYNLWICSTKATFIPFILKINLELPS